MAHIHDIKIGNTNYLIEPTLFGAATTSDSGANYSVTLGNFELANATGVAVQVKFPSTNAASAKLNVNSSGAKNIYYNNAAISASVLKANHTYTLVYDGTQWQLVGDIDTNTQAAYGNITTSGTLGTASSLVVTDSNKKITTGAAIGSAVSSQTQSTKFLREDGTWATPSYTTNTNNAVTQTGNTENKEFSILLKNTNNTTDETAGVKYGKTSNKLVTVNPSTGGISAAVGTFSGNVSIGGNVIFPNANILDWNGATYRQRITITDDSTADTAVFTFQQSSNTGTSYSDLFTIKDNGTVIATLFSGSGASLTSLNASNISSGTLSADRLATSGATAGSYGPSAAVTGSNGATMNVPYITVDDKGRVTAISNKVYTAVNTWRGIQDNLTSSDKTTESLSAKQGYLLANGSARDSTKLPLAGGNMTGNIGYTDGTNAKTMIQFITGNVNGHAIKIGGGAATVVAAGESVSISPTATAENLYLLADAITYIYANADTLANRIGFAVNTSGHILPQKAEAANSNKQNLGASDNKWASIFGTTFDGSVLKLHQGNAADPSLTGNARIEFDYSGGQPVVISYTPNDSYRNPAGLKVMGGTSATPAWFEVEGTVYAAGFSGSGASLTSLNGSNISSGTVADARIASSIARLASPALTGTPTAPTAANGTNTTQIATTAFVNNTLSYVNAMQFKGTLGTGGTITALPAAHDAGDTYRVITAGTYAGKYCEVGTLIICVKDGTTAADNDWTSVETNEDGAVIGPASSTDGNIVLFDGTSGRIIKNSSYSPSSFAAASHGLHVPTLPTSSSTAYFLRGDNAWSNVLGSFKFISGEDISETAANLSGTTTANTMTFYRNGISIPYQMSNANDGGILRVRGTSESTTILELGTWDDSGAGETIQFNYYPTTSRATPTYSVTVPKHSGTLVTTDGNGASGSWGISVTGSSGSCTGNAATATAFNSNATVTLTGDTTGISAGSTKNWSIATTTKKVTPTDASSTDLNTLTNLNTEYYYGSGSNTATNGPVTVGAAFGLHMFKTAAGYVRQEFAVNGGDKYYRTYGSSTWSEWAKYLSSANYTSYTVTKTGSGASGTWGISVTGSSGSCTGLAAKATADASGNTITSYYCTLSTAQTISGAKTFTGNLQWGASGAGGYLNGSATDGGCNSIRIGNDTWFGDVNIGGIIGVQAAASATTNCGFLFKNGAGTEIGRFYANGTNFISTKSIVASTTGLNLGSTSTVWDNVYANTFHGALTGNAATATKVAAKLATTTVAYLLGTSTSITGTAANVELIGDTGVYLTSIAGELSAVRHSYNISGTTKAYTTFNSTDNSIDFIFA